MKYLNRFSIEEDDQFEVHVKNYPYEHNYNIGKTVYYNSAKEVILKAKEGSGYYRLKIQNY